MKCSLRHAILRVKSFMTVVNSLIYFPQKEIYKSNEYYSARSCLQSFVTVIMLVPWGWCPCLFRRFGRCSGTLLSTYRWSGCRTTLGTGVRPARRWNNGITYLLNKDFSFSLYCKSRFTWQQRYFSTTLLKYLVLARRVLTGTYFERLLGERDRERDLGERDLDLGERERDLERELLL